MPRKAGRSFITSAEPSPVSLSLSVPRSLYRSYNATKHVVTFYNASNLFFGHVKTDADLLQYQGAEFLFIGWEELTQFTYSQWDFLKGSNRRPIKTYWHKGCEYAVRPRIVAAT